MNPMSLAISGPAQPKRTGSQGRGDGQGMNIISPKMELHTNKNLGEPSHKSKVRGHKSPPVPMGRSHGARASAKGRDTRMGNANPPLGRKDTMQPGVAQKGAMRFADQGR